MTKVKTIDTEVPAWAHWISKDSDGLWTAHQKCPDKMQSGKLGFWESSGLSITVGKGMPTKSWTDELYEI